ncbi:hypothetical protein AZE42_12463 [Rhizopogon vesiculosus]|uniref:Uncharacterized protein n=1 Tax=Rhizopogon vesiculosus TaxID=180088 RepID=A0A1J8QGP4_9AGAM|nr:hypothetical protein AZE42_12463 [Rhizopogon vesiculosus]
MPRSSPSYTDAALSFSCRMNAPPDRQSSSSTSKISEDSMSVVYPYPPTLPTAPIVITLPTPQSIKAWLDNKNIAILIDAVRGGAAARTGPDVVYPARTIDIFKQSTFTNSIVHTHAIQPQPQPQSTQCGKSDVTDYSSITDPPVDLP